MPLIRRFAPLFRQAGEGRYRARASDRLNAAAEVPPRYLQMLCDTYQKSDDDGRRLTRILAELSINKSEGVPTRRYIP